MLRRVIRITNRSAAGHYPREVDALVFELAGALWFYTDCDGTQNLSRYWNRPDQDKAQLDTLLPAIDPGFSFWIDAPPAPAGMRDDGLALRNGCFIESLAILRLRLAAGLPASHPRLLSYYTAIPGGVHGHTVLQFLTPKGWMVIDPHAPKRQVRIQPRQADDARVCADCLRPDVVQARMLKLDGIFEAATQLALASVAKCDVVGQVPSA